MRLRSNCSVGPLQAKLKIISEADGGKRARCPSTKESEKPSRVSQRQASARLGLPGLWLGVQLRGNRPRCWGLSLKPSPRWFLAGHHKSIFLVTAAKLLLLLSWAIAASRPHWNLALPAGSLVFTAGFLCLGTIDKLGCIVLCCGKLPWALWDI